jgi:lysophospholipase L1-like esterase
MTRRAIVTVGALLCAGFAFGQFVAGASASRAIAPLRFMQDAGAAVANRLASSRGLEPNAAYPERREQFRLFVRPVDVVMVGDSITAAGMWEDMFPSVRIANRGIGSDRTDDVLRRLGPIVEGRPRSALIMLGINDLSAGRAVDDIAADYARIVDALRGRGIRVIVQSTLECNVGIRRRCRSMLPEIRRLNARLAALAESRGLAFIDLNVVLSEPVKGLRAEHTTDGTHLTGRGYAEWAKRIAPWVAGR